MLASKSHWGAREVTDYESEKSKRPKQPIDRIHRLEQEIDALKTAVARFEMLFDAYEERIAELEARR